MVGLAVIVGILVSKGSCEILSVCFGFLTGFFISAYSMVVNDYFDLEVDKINALDRPLVKGEVNVPEAKAFASILLILGLSFSWFTGFTTFMVALSFAILSFLYNWKFKEYGLIGNFIVAASIAIPFVYGSLITNGITLLVLSLAMTAFFAGTGREVVKDIVDVKGDALRNVRTIPRIYGAKWAGRLGAMFFLIAITSSLIPVMLRRVGLLYIILIGMTDVIFLALTVLTIKDTSREGAYRVKRIALYAMLLGLAGYLLEGVGA